MATITSTSSDTSLHEYNQNISHYRHLFNRERVNLESYQLVWLDDNVNNNKKDITGTLEGLRIIIDYTKLFDNAEECRQFIEQTKDTTTFLICSGQLGQGFVPEIYHLKKIWSIYIYCQNKEYCQK